MTDLPISNSQPTHSAERVAPTFARLITMFQAAFSALGRAATEHARRRAARRAPDEILMAHARREEARRAVDKLLLLR